MSTYAIGDVQGCFEQLNILLDRINFDPADDLLWFAGDIINRGPQSLDTLRFIQSLGDRAITVLGNHDLHLLAIANGRGKQGKHDTIKDILDAEDREELLHWLLHRPLMHYDQDLDICMSHAGIYPAWSIVEALQYAKEIESVLQGHKSHEFFHHMYGDKPPAWSKHLKGWDRLRFITNAFTRMRYCDELGHLSLREKGTPEKQAHDLVPWFNSPNRKTNDTAIIFGHWSTLGKPDKQNIYPVDSGCLWGGQLTALKIDTASFERIEIPCPNIQPIN